MLTETQHALLAELEDQKLAFEHTPRRIPACDGCVGLPFDERCGLSCSVVIDYYITTLTRQINDLKLQETERS